MDDLVAQQVPSVARTVLLSGRTITRCFRCNSTDIMRFLQPEDTDVEVFDFQDTIVPLLPETVSSIEFVNCSIPNSIAGFPSALHYLLFKNCGTNFITSITQFPDSIWSLSIIDCGITKIAPLPTTLSSLYLVRNKLTSLPALPPTLTILNVNGNELTSLPDPLPPELRSLEANNNKIQKINKLSGNLLYGQFDNNLLTEIPPIAIAENPILTFNNNPLEEPFKSIYEEYKRGGGGHLPLLIGYDRLERHIEVFKAAVNEVYNKRTRSKGQNIRTLSELAGRRRNNSFTRNTSTGPKEYVNVTSKIASFLSGKQGTVSNQLSSLKSNILGGKRRKTRRRKTNKKKN